MTDPDPVMLRTAALGRRFGSAWAIRDMDLEVRRGEVLGLLGPNGAGNATTVRLLTAQTDQAHDQHHRRTSNPSTVALPWTARSADRRRLVRSRGDPHSLAVALADIGLFT